MKKSRKSVFGITVILLIILSVTSQASGIREAFRIFQENPEPFGIALHAEIIKIPHFSDDRTEKLNRLLKHFDLTVASDGTNSKNTVTADGKAVFSWKEEAEKEEKGFIPFGAVQRYGNIWFSLRHFASWFEKLPEKAKEKAASSKINTRYKEYGTAIRKETFSLTADEMKELVENEQQTWHEGSFYPNPLEMQFEGRQRIILQYRETGQILRVNYSGKCGLTPEDIRNVTIDWKILREDQREKDQIQIRTPSGTKSDRDNLLSEREWILQEDGSEQLTWKVETDRVQNRIRTQIRMNASIRARFGIISGKVQEVSTEQGQTVSTEITANMAAAEDIPTAGTLEIIHKTGKIDSSHMKISFGFSHETKPMLFRESQPSQPDPESLEQQLAAAMLRAMMTFPEEDLAFLTEGIEEEQWNALLQILNAQKENEP